jgi:hypothetical protein
MRERRWWMKSFAVRLEPVASPRLAAVVLLAHLTCAVLAWLVRVPAPIAALLSAIAMAGLPHSLSRLPGRHCRLAAARHDGRRWMVRLAGSRRWLPAELEMSSRAYPALVHAAFRAGGRRLGWLLPPGSVPDDAFRRLKARIRLAC